MHEAWFSFGDPEVRHDEVEAAGRIGREARKVLAVDVAVPVGLARRDDVDLLVAETAQFAQQPRGLAARSPAAAPPSAR